MDLRQGLSKRAELLNVELAKFLENGEPKTLYDAARHLPLAGGKRLRPILAMITCEALGGNVKKLLPITIALELIHNFTLVHDDIMDKSNLRRNLPTVHIKYDEPTAIIAGDLLFAKAFESMHNLVETPSNFKRLNYGLLECVREICEGQQLDMEFEKRKMVTEQEYIEMIRKKTAFFFQFAAESGAILANASDKEIDAMSTYGLSIGLAFQIQDDYLDMSSDKETLGKDIGNDIRNGKKTLIAVRSLSTAQGEDKELLKRVFGNRNATDHEIKKVYDLFWKKKSIDYAKQTAVNYSLRAKESLSVIPENSAKQILIDLAEYTIKREK
ncbi:MAG: polyprenyl synthetase family protein [Candidatus Thermoplasmatota archaeon]|nr:polyprenyl synthetase family protein [Candidatus Thermoplasmatota archaeon]